MDEELYVSCSNFSGDKNIKLFLFIYLNFDGQNYHYLIKINQGSQLSLLDKTNQDSHKLSSRLNKKWCMKYSAFTQGPKKGRTPRDRQPTLMQAIGHSKTTCSLFQGSSSPV